MTYAYIILSPLWRNYHDCFTRYQSHLAEIRLDGRVGSITSKLGHNQQMIWLDDEEDMAVFRLKWADKIHMEPFTQ
jgi:hypothetical protein